MKAKIKRFSNRFILKRKELKKKLIILFLIIFKLSILLNAQEKETFQFYEDTLKKLGLVIRNGENERVKFEASERFSDLLEDALLLKRSFDYPFDSLNTIARLVSPDKRFRIFNWVISKSNGTYEYFCFLQSYNDKKDKYEVFKLIDKNIEITTPEFQTLDVENWYGALYYKIILVKNEDVCYYTLLGWNGNDGISFKKIIEVLTFRAGNRPFFGALIFRKGKEKPKRIIFEYSSKAIMNLKYEKQQYQLKKRLSKPKNGKRFENVEIKKDMILFDRLVPLNQSLEGLKQYYVPETNILDAFVFEKGKWVFFEDIDARNPAKPELKTPPEKRKELPIYSPKN